jgi:hypothetical protein
VPSDLERKPERRQAGAWSRADDWREQVECLTTESTYQLARGVGLGLALLAVLALERWRPHQQLRRRGVPTSGSGASTRS